MRQDAVVVTLFSLEHSERPGTSLLCCAGATTGSIQHGALKKLALTDAEAALRNASSTLQEYELDGKCINAFIEYIKPPVAVVIAGAGNDVKPLVEMTSLLGWQTTVVDGQGTHAMATRSATVDTDLPPLDQEIPSDRNHLHYGAGETDARISEGIQLSINAIATALRNSG